MTSTKKNIAWSMVLSVSNYVFPLITYPYVSRVLGVNNIGICNYVDSIINYFILFSMLGVGSLGVREIAKVKDNKEKLQKVFSSLVAVLFVLVIISTVILLILTYTLSLFEPYKPFLLVGVVKLIFTAFTLSWLFQGLSEFRFVTITSIVIRIMYVIAVFAFVQDQSDCLKFFFFVSLTIVLNAVINWRYASKLVNFDYKSIHIKFYIGAILSYGSYLILTSMYTSFNVFFLGSVSSNIEVGYFSTATKLFSILMSVFSAFTTVMVPRVVELIERKDYAQLNSISKQTFQLIFAFSFPIIIGSEIYAESIIKIIAGQGYEGAVLPFRIVMFLMLVIALEQIIIQQFLMAVRESKCIVILSSIGAVVSITLNIILTPKIMSIGSSISWTVSELCILSASLYYFNKYFKFPLVFKIMPKYFLTSIPYVAFCLLFYTPDVSLRLVIGFVLCLIWFYICNVIILKNEPIVQMIDSFKAKLFK